jgi:hypothetical protein
MGYYASSSYYRNKLKKMSTIVEGKIYRIFETVEISDTFKKREFVIETEDKYPQKIKIQCTQSKCDFLDNFKVGQVVEVHCNLRGTEWTSPKKEVKFFLSLDCWKIDRIETATVTIETVTATDIDSDTDIDDLPF